MDCVKLRQVVETKQAIGETDDKEVGGCMERRAIDFGIVLHEVILLDNSPPGLRNVLHGIRIFLGYVLPSEKRAILADSVNLE